MDRAPSFALVLVLLAVTLGVGIAVKQPCASGNWDGRQYTRLCYTDLIPLYGTEHLQGNRLPYLDACPADEGQCDEYPVLTMYAMRAAASSGWTSSRYSARWASASARASSSRFPRPRSLRIQCSISKVV